MRRERSAANKDDHDLSSNNDELNPNEEPVPLYAFEYIEFIVKPPIIVLIENLHPDKGVENDGLQLVKLALTLVREKRASTKIKYQSDH